MGDNCVKLKVPLQELSQLSFASRRNLIPPWRTAPAGRVSSWCGLRGFAGIHPSNVTESSHQTRSPLYRLSW